MNNQIHEECGVFGIYSYNKTDVAYKTYHALFALQHRGQESCGIATSDTNGPSKVYSSKDMGLLNEAFTPDKLSQLKGNIGVGLGSY